MLVPEKLVTISLIIGSSIIMSALISRSIIKLLPRFIFNGLEPENAEIAFSRGGDCTLRCGFVKNSAKRSLSVAEFLTKSSLCPECAAKRKKGEKEPERSVASATTLEVSLAFCSLQKDYLFFSFFCGFLLTLFIAARGERADNKIVSNNFIVCKPPLDQWQKIFRPNRS